MPLRLVELSSSDYTLCIPLVYSVEWSAATAAVLNHRVRPIIGAEHSLLKRTQVQCWNPTPPSAERMLITNNNELRKTSIFSNVESLYQRAPSGNSSTMKPWKCIEQHRKLSVTRVQRTWFLSTSGTPSSQPSALSHNFTLLTTTRVAALLQ